MKEEKQKALKEAGWSIGSAEEFLGMEKLDFGLLQHDNVLEACVNNKDNICFGFFHISFKRNFIVTASINSKYFEIRNDCKDIYEALDAANEWWNKNKQDLVA